MKGSTTDTPVMPASRPDNRWTRRTALVAAVAVLLLGFAASAYLWRSKTAAVSSASVGVLPFTNESSDRKDEFLSDSMAYEIITQFGKVSNLRVTSRTSVARFRGTRRPVKGIAKELGVSRIVEGSLLRAGPSVRMSVSLTDPAADRQMVGDLSQGVWTREAAACPGACRLWRRRPSATTIASAR